MSSMKTFSLSFSGGGAKSLVYLGFLRELESWGLKPDYIAAVSGGAWLLCLLASELDDQELLEMISLQRRRNFLSYSPITSRGLFNPKKLEGLLKKISNNKNIEDLGYNSVIAVSDITDAVNPETVYVENGSLSKWAVISSSLPPLLPIQKFKNRLYADGGYTTIYCSEFLENKNIEVQIGLIPTISPRLNSTNLINDLARAMRSVMSARNRLERKFFPVDLEIKEFSINGGILSFRKVFEMYKAGQEKAQEMKSQILGLLE